MVVFMRHHFARVENAFKHHLDYCAMLWVAPARIRLRMERHPNTHVAVLLKDSAAFPIGMAGALPRTCASASQKTQALHSTLDG